MSKQTNSNALRNVSDHLATGLASLATVLVLVPLVAIFGYLVYRGAGSIDMAFFTQISKPVGESGGGMANAIAGTGLILGMASFIGLPLGMGAGIYLAEYGQNRFGTLVFTRWWYSSRNISPRSPVLSQWAS